MRLYNFLYKFMGVEFDKNVKLQGFPIIIKKKKSKISVGKNVTIKSSFFSNLIGLYQRSVIVARTPESVIEIGDNVGASGVTIYARDSIKIGSNTRIGGNSKILDNDFHPVDPEMRLHASNENMKVRPIVIGENVFIGCNCLILKGTEIGDNTTIGAGSVVTGKIPANCIAAGNPARVIKVLDGVNDG